MQNSWMTDAKPLIIIIGAACIIALVGCALENWYENKNPQKGICWYCATFEMEAAIGERAMLERDLAETSWERVQEGTASESDHERAVQYEMEHSV